MLLPPVQVVVIGEDEAADTLEAAATVGYAVNKSVLREILNHRLCVVHPNIVQFREIFLTPVHLAIVMEYAAGGDMFEYVIRHKMPQHGQGLAEDSARAFFQQLIIALDFCHELGIANR